MSYSICYGPERPKPEQKKRSYFGLAGAVAIIIICSIAIGWAIPQQVNQFVQALLPWTRSEVIAAFSELRNDVKEGKSINDAVTDFCLEIINAAEQSR